MASLPPEPPAGAPSAPMDDHDALPAGTRFGELEIIRVLGIGGFGIVYLAIDHALEREVALKEYMPGSLAGRGKGQMVSIRSGAHSETYALGLRSFVNEARLLARFNHPSLVKVYRFWEENGTAYMVMPYLQGRTLRDVRRSMAEPPSEAWIRSVINPILDALELLHREGVYHRDIAPDNILLPPGELPVLLDFGAARRAIGDHTQTFTAILKPSYAPIEQYAEVVQLRQGPWTDLYALGAVVFYLLRGAPPPPATARAVQDDVALLVHDDFPALSEHFIAAIDWALSIRPSDRPQNIAALREVFDGRQPAPPRSRLGITMTPGGGGFGIDAAAPGGAPNTFAPTMRVTGQATEIATARMDRGLTRPDLPSAEPPRAAPPQFEPARAEPTRQPTLRVEPTRAEPTRPMTAAPRRAAAAEADPTVVLTRPPVGVPAARTRVDAPVPRASDEEVTLPPPMPPPRPTPEPTMPAPPRVAVQPAAPATGSRIALWIASFAATIALGAGGAYLWAARSAGPVEPPGSAASEPSATPLAVPAPVVVPDAAPAPGPVAVAVPAPVPLAPPVADTSAATANTSTPNPGPPQPAASVVPPTSNLTAAAAASAAAARLRPRDLLARPGTRADGALVPLPPEQRVVERPVPRPEESAANYSTSSNARPAPSLPLPAAPLRQGPATPREACGSRVFLALALCMEEQCDKAGFKSHPQCEAVREMVERRRRREN